MRPDEMLAAVIAAIVEKSRFDPEKIEDAVVGCANQAGEVAAPSGAMRGSSPACRSRSRARSCSAIAAAA